MATYVEGSSLHPERGGASTFARYAFDELWSFIAGWAILLDYLIVMAIGAVAISDYLAVFWGGLDEGIVEVVDRGRRDRCSWPSRTCAAWAPTGSRMVLRLSLVGIVLLLVVIGDRARPELGPGRDHRLDPTWARRRSGTSCCSRPWSRAWR